MVRVAINGYGRIGRIAHRVLLQWHSGEAEVVAINAGSSTDITGWMYLLKYDSVYGLLPFDVTVKQNTDPAKKDLLGHLVISGKEIPVYSQKDPTLLPWRDLQIDVVIESTGVFTSADRLRFHLNAGAKYVVLSAPAKGEGVPTYVVSVNETNYQGEQLISNASCTTNCITPVARVIHEQFGIEKAMMTTIHGYTSDQRLHDGGHKDYRRARAADLNIIPTSTGATVAAAEAFPALKGIFAGLAIRVPVPVGSLSDCTFLLKRDVTKDEINDALRRASEAPTYKGVLAVTEDPLVSSDIIGNSHSSIVDLGLTQVVGGNMLKVIVWYDNEYGYANRLVEQTIMVGQRTTSETQSSSASTQSTVQPGSAPTQEGSTPIQSGQPSDQPSQQAVQSQPVQEGGAQMPSAPAQQQSAPDQPVSAPAQPAGVQTQQENQSVVPEQNPAQTGSLPTQGDSGQNQLGAAQGQGQTQSESHTAPGEPPVSQG